MTPRNPDESPEHDVQDTVPQAIRESLHGITPGAAEPGPCDVSPLVSGQDAPVGAEIEFDRVEAYLKGPTAFAA